jgi:hypothetical protein
MEYVMIMDVNGWLWPWKMVAAFKRDHQSICLSQTVWVGRVCNVCDGWLSPWTTIMVVKHMLQTLWVGEVCGNHKRWWIVVTTRMVTIAAYAHLRLSGQEECVMIVSVDGWLHPQRTHTQSIRSLTYHTGSWSRAGACNLWLLECASICSCQTV